MLVICLKPENEPSMYRNISSTARAILCTEKLNFRFKIATWYFNKLCSIHCTIKNFALAEAVLFHNAVIELVCFTTVF